MSVYVYDCEVCVCIKDYEKIWVLPIIFDLINNILWYRSQKMDAFEIFPSTIEKLKMNDHTLWLI